MQIIRIDSKWHSSLFTYSKRLNNFLMNLSPVRCQKCIYRVYLNKQCDRKPYYCRSLVWIISVPYYTGSGQASHLPVINVALKDQYHLLVYRERFPKMLSSIQGKQI